MTKCLECRFWTNEYSSDDEDPGQCRRRAPQRDDGVAKWPYTMHDWWCGEFETGSEGVRENVWRHTIHGACKLDSLACPPEQKRDCIRHLRSNYNYGEGVDLEQPEA